MIKAIAFDLDDTLLDTSGLLTPKASRDTFSLMIEKGLKLSLSECESFRTNLIRTYSHREVFEKLANTYGTPETIEHLPQIYDSFYFAKLPDTLPLIKDARQNLDYLKTKYTLYLVTAGIESSQLGKVQALGIKKDFKDVFVVNSLLKHKKKDAFQKIIEIEKIKPNELLCVGNSLLSEIQDALSLGAKACYFEHGEERGKLSDLPRLPDYHVKNHSELIKACQL
jgi:putative hydrolase of the HAD superfamily